MSFGEDAAEWKRFLEEIETWQDPTWGFLVYGTFKRLAGGTSQGNGQEATDNAPFEAALSRLRAHAEDFFRHHKPPPYNQKLIDKLRLEPGGYFPGASLADVCTHFRDNYAYIVDRGRQFEPEYEKELQETQGWKCGPKYDWCLVIDDESLESLESAPEPHGPTPPKRCKPR